MESVLIILDSIWTFISVRIDGFLEFLSFSVSDIPDVPEAFVSAIGDFADYSVLNLLFDGTIQVLVGVYIIIPLIKGVFNILS